VLYLSGQTANAADGEAMHSGDLVAQFRLAWSNLKDSLSIAGMDPSNIVRLNMYTTDVDSFMAAAGEIVPIFAGTVANRLVRSSVAPGSSSLRSWSNLRQQPSLDGVRNLWSRREGPPHAIQKLLRKRRRGQTLRGGCWRGSS